MNIDDIKQLDCRDWIAREIGQPIKDRGNRWAWACPLHNGKNPNFTADSDGWRCWSDCGEGGDLISFIQKYHGLNFVEACKYLGASDISYKPLPAATKPQWKPEQPPSEVWQDLIEDLANKAIACLWSDKGKIARDYLHGRGITDETIERANLGYIPENKKWYTIEHGILVPSGITIPSTLNGELWQVRVRRVINATKGDKYKSIGDGRLVGSLFWGDYIQPQLPIVIVESEMDCLTLVQVQGDFCPVALSSASNTLTKHWLTKMIFAPFILLRTDLDEAGQRCQERILALSDSIKPIPVPHLWKDVNEMFTSDPRYGCAWLMTVLNRWYDDFAMQMVKEHAAEVSYA